VEGIYMNTGTICNIDRMVELKHKYKLRFFIDESVSFGTLGANGKGITEHARLELNDIDLIMATLEYSIGSIGGFCVGTTYVVEHQTLAGLGSFVNELKIGLAPFQLMNFPSGYCFSASLPPMLAAGAMKAIELMEESPKMFSDLRYYLLLLKLNIYCNISPVVL
jgi:serine palmitoyltransferase